MKNREIAKVYTHKSLYLGSIFTQQERIMKRTRITKSHQNRWIRTSDKHFRRIATYSGNQKCLLKQKRKIKREIKIFFSTWSWWCFSCCLRCYSLQLQSSLEWPVTMVNTIPVWKKWGNIVDHSTLIAVHAYKLRSRRNVSTIPSARYWRYFKKIIIWMWTFDMSWCYQE